VHNVLMTRSKKLDELVSSVEDLLARLPDNLTPELAELRDRVDSAIFEAWTRVASEGRETLNRASRRSADRFWIIAGVTLLAGTGSLVAYRITRPPRHVYRDAFVFGALAAALTAAFRG
jgi:hypothetical protein